jgi:ATP adenylyltransferase
VGLSGVAHDDEVRQSGPYNLLLTRRFMLLVPRSQECYRNVSLNALAFAGAMLVRDPFELAELYQDGPMHALAAAALPLAKLHPPKA